MIAKPWRISENKQEKQVSEMLRDSHELVHLIPDARDGMNTLQRRILYGMFRFGYVPPRPHQASAHTVGNVMAFLHRICEAPIYCEMVRLVQAESVRYPLIDGSGDFGSLDESPAPFPRTRARMSPISMTQCTDFKYDPAVRIPLKLRERFSEPPVLPSQLPMLLINGSVGIEGQSASRIPSHNLAEVVDAVIAKIDNPQLDSLSLLQYIKGPDFPQGGIVVDSESLRQAYLTGIGSLTCRGHVRLGRKSLVVHSLPFFISPGSITHQVLELIEAGTLPNVESVSNKSTRNTTHIVIRLCSKDKAADVLKALYSLTELQITIQINMLAFRVREENHEPSPENYDASLKSKACQLELMTLESMISDFIAHRVDSVMNSTKLRLQEARASASKMQLRNSMTASEKDSTQELQGLMSAIEEFEYLLSNRDGVLEMMKKELQELKNGFGDSRRTEIVSVNKALESAPLPAPSLNEATPFFVVLSLQPNTTATQTAMVYRIETRHTFTIDYDTCCEPLRLEYPSTGNCHVFVCSSAGMCSTIHEDAIPLMSITQGGIRVMDLDRESFIAGFEVFEPALDYFVLFITNDGYAKRVRLAELQVQEIGSEGQPGITIDRAESLVCSALLVKAETSLFAFTTNEHSYTSFGFRADEVPVQKASQSGVRLSKLPHGESINTVTVKLDHEEDEYPEDE